MMNTTATALAIKIKLIAFRLLQSSQITLLVIKEFCLVEHNNKAMKKKQFLGRVSKNDEAIYAYIFLSFILARLW
jgi:hypothetical protein